MRILFVLDGLFMGGAERNTVQLMRALSKLGHVVHLCTLRPVALDDGAGLSVGLSDSDHTTLNVRRIYDPRGFRRFLALVAQFKPDVIHVEDPYANVLTLVAKRVHGVPAVMTRHVAGDTSDVLWDRARLSLLKKSAKAAFDRAILVAEALRNDFCAEYAFPTHKVVTIHNGVSIEGYSENGRRLARAELAWPEHVPIITMVAVFRAGKGHATLLDAFRRVLRVTPHAILHFVGDGSLRPEFERQAADLGTSVAFLGERHDVLLLMRASDAIILPSESEALPTVLLEAAAVGCPAIASNVGGTSEIVEHGVTGFLVQARNPEALAAAITEFLHDPALRKRLGRAAHQNAELKFSIERQASLTLALYETLLRERAATG